ncbi:MAG: ATP-binding protein [Candidatus Omnitrophica bacterium]|nr:ATP-binding protein [Candidatus Omnitrophota bacterium]
MGEHRKIADSLRVFTIGTKLRAAFLCVALIPLIVFACASYFEYAKTIKEELLDSLVSQSELIVDKIESYVLDYEKGVAVLSSRPALTNVVEELIRIFKSGKLEAQEYAAFYEKTDEYIRYFKDNYGYYNILIISPEGDVVLSLLREADLGTNLSTGPYKNSGLARIFRASQTLLDTEISDFEYYPPSNIASAFVAAPILKDGNVIGVVAAQIGYERVYDFLDKHAVFGDTGETMIGYRVSNEELLIGYSKEYKMLVQNQPKFNSEPAFEGSIVIGSDKGIAMQQAVLGRRERGVYTDYRGKEVLAVCQYLPYFNWGVVVKINTDEVYAPLVKLTKWMSMAVFLLALFVALIALFISRSISAPIIQLTQATKEIASGNLTAKIAIKSLDEIGQLAVSFNKMTEELKDAQDTAVRAEKLAAIGKLSSGIAHELRNPLGVMKNVVYYLNMLELGKDNPDVTENIEVLSKEIERSDKIISDLLEFARAKKPALKSENVNDIVKDILKRLEISSAVEITTELDNNLPAVEADAIQLQHVFYNIATNALQAMEKDGGRLKIRTGLKGNFAEISFADTGCGIPEENRNKVFDPLFSTKQKGTGLGLSVCQSLVEGHHGMIEVESQPGKGTTFTVKLPVKRRG